MNTNYFTKLPLWDKIHRFVTRQLTDTELNQFKSEISNAPPTREKIISAQAWEMQESTKRTKLPFPIYDNNSTHQLKLQEELKFWNDIAFAIQHNYLIQTLEKADNLLPVSNPKPWYIRKPLYTGIAASLTLFFTATVIYLYSVQVSAKQNYTFLKNIPVYQNTFIQKMSAYQLLMDHQYRQASESFQFAKDSILNEYGDSEETLMPYYIDLYQAITQIKLENFDRAIIILEDLCTDEKIDGIDQPEHLYLGLLYFAKKKYPEAEYHLSVAASSPGILTYIKDEDQLLTITEIAEKYLNKIPDKQ